MISRSVLFDLPQNVRDIWHYGVTEMVNNAIDHSASPEVRVGLRRNALFTAVAVADDGEGIFLKIQRALGLYDAREAILELAKGKLTTAPQNHSGEGIFSRREWSMRSTFSRVDSISITSSGPRTG
jgi:signal transduction histidine kinase